MMIQDAHINIPGSLCKDYAKSLLSRRKRNAVSHSVTASVVRRTK